MFPFQHKTMEYIRCNLDTFYSSHLSLFLNVMSFYFEWNTSSSRAKYYIDFCDFACLPPQITHTLLPFNPSIRINIYCRFLPLRLQLISANISKKRLQG